ncbi:MAG: S8 family serine peptidase [Rhizobium sp.]
MTLRSYRVFRHTGGGATNYDIMNAIDRAVQDGCHIINLSLGGASEDEAVRTAIGRALDNRVLVIAAVGNDLAATARHSVF